MSGWHERCGIQKIRQLDPYGCGVACLAMVTGTSYEQSREAFNRHGLGVRRKSRPPYSTASWEMRMVVEVSGLLVSTRRWSGWDSFQGLGVLKVRDDWRGAVGRWHWVVAFRHPEFEIAVFDPHQCNPAFRQMPLDVECFNFDIYEPKGDWLMVEQKFRLDLS